MKSVEQAQSFAPRALGAQCPLSHMDPARGGAEWRERSHSGTTRRGDERSAVPRERGPTQQQTKNLPPYHPHQKNRKNMLLSMCSYFPKKETHEEPDVFRFKVPWGSFPGPERRGGGLLSPGLGKWVLYKTFFPLLLIPCKCQAFCRRAGPTFFMLGFSH